MAGRLGPGFSDGGTKGVKLPAAQVWQFLAWLAAEAWTAHLGPCTRRVMLSSPEGLLSRQQGNDVGRNGRDTPFIVEGQGSRPR